MMVINFHDKCTFKKKIKFWYRTIDVIYTFCLHSVYIINQLAWVTFSRFSLTRFWEYSLISTAWYISHRYFWCVFKSLSSTSESVTIYFKNSTSKSLQVIKLKHKGLLQDFIPEVGPSSVKKLYSVVIRLNEENKSLLVLYIWK